MPKLLRVELTPEQRDEQRGRLRAREVPLHIRLRLECVRWSDAGLTVPQIAGRVGCHKVTTLARADLDALAAILDAAARRGRTVPPARRPTGWRPNGGCGSPRPA